MRMSRHEGGFKSYIPVDGSNTWWTTTNMQTKKGMLASETGNVNWLTTKKIALYLPIIHDGLLI